MNETPTTLPDGRIACKVRRFAARHCYGPHPPGAIVYIDPDTRSRTC